MLPRFFVPDAGRTSAATPLRLPDDEAAHAARVLRLSQGDAVRVFDGDGREWQAEIAAIDRQHVAVVLGAAIAPALEARIAIVLAMAVLKGDKMDGVVRDAVMLGVAAVQPLVTDRTEIGLSALAAGRRRERWQRVAVASCKQCGRAVVPQIAAPCAYDDWIAAPSSDARVLLVEPRDDVRTASLHALAVPAAAQLIVGPEGGWTSRELDLARRAGLQMVTLGTTTLRADAAPLVALTALRTVWRDLR